MITSSPSINQSGVIRLNGFTSKFSDFQNLLSSQQAYLGFDASQNQNYIYIKKAELLGLTPMLNNTAESLLIGIINRLITNVADKRIEAEVSYWGAVVENGLITKTIEIKLYNLLSVVDYEIQYTEIAAHTGKIGNALKKGGVILESAYGWMNPQPKFNRVTKFLEGLQNGASTIQMVTQAPLDVINATTEFTTASTEFVKAIKEDDKPENKATPTPEPDELKANEAKSKADSQPLNFDFADLFDGED